MDAYEDMLATEILHNTVTRWLAALAVLVVGLVVLRIAKSIVSRRLRKFAERTKTTVDDLVARLVARTRLFFLLGISTYFASQIVALPERASTLIARIVLVVVLVQAGIWGTHVVKYVVRHYVHPDPERPDETQMSQSALVFLGRVALWSLVLILALDNLGFDITALVTGLGIGGVAVALAVRNILGDLLGSLTIMLDQPFSVGDFIVVGDFMGVVEHIGWKTTRARSVDGEELIFANSDLLQSRLRNYRRIAERRAVMTVGVTYETPEELLALVPKLLEEIVGEHDGTRFDRAHFKRLGASSLDFEMVYWMEDADFVRYMDTLQSINLGIVRRFREEGIAFAYPTQKVLVDGARRATADAA